MNLSFIEGLLDFDIIYIGTVFIFDVMIRLVSHCDHELTLQHFEVSDYLLLNDKLNVN